MNLATWLRKSAETHGDQPAVARGSTTVQTYTELADRAAKLATGLAMLGLSPGDRVAMAFRSWKMEYECIFCSGRAERCAEKVDFREMVAKSYVRMYPTNSYYYWYMTNWNLTISIFCT